MPTAAPLHDADRDAERSRADRSVPTGPFHSFIALPYPLPPGAQARLQTLSAAVTEATANNKTDGPDAASARRLLADYIGRLRETIGEELIRREFLPGQPSQ